MSSERMSPKSIANIMSDDECPIFDGIFFPDGTVIPITSSDGGAVLVSGDRVTLASIAARAGPLGWTFLGRLCEATASHLIAAGGEGWLGGDGFLMLACGEEVRWLLFSTDSNPFVTVEFFGTSVRGTTSHGVIWSVPLEHPGDFSVFRPQLP